MVGRHPVGCRAEVLRQGSTTHRAHEVHIREIGDNSIRGIFLGDFFFSSDVRLVVVVLPYTLLIWYATRRIGRRE